MKYILILAITTIAISCKSSEKYDFSNVQSTSTDAMHNPNVKVYNGGPVVAEPIDKDTIRQK